MVDRVEAIHPSLDALLSGLQESARSTRAGLQEADALEARADQLRRSSPGVLDDAIQSSTEELMGLAELEDPSVSARDILDGVLRVNEFTPNGVLGHRPIGNTGVLSILDMFDGLTDGEPILFYSGSSWSTFNPGIVSDRPVSVAVSEMRGMGGLPEAHITYGVRMIEEDALDDEVTITQTHKHFARNAVGITAIQKLIDSQRLSSEPYTCGRRHGERTNYDSIRQLSAAASALVRVSGVSLDTTSIEDALRTIEEKEAALAADAERHKRRSRRQALWA